MVYGTHFFLETSACDLYIGSKPQGLAVIFSHHQVYPQGLGASEKKNKKNTI